MDRRELEERYTEVGRSLPTDLGRMVRSVALVRLALLLGCGALLAMALCAFGGLAWFAIVGTNPTLAPATTAPVPTTPTATPASAGSSASEVARPTRAPAIAVPGPRLPGGVRARGEGQEGCGRAVKARRGAGAR